jgi:hypothetical protein
MIGHLTLELELCRFVITLLLLGASTFNCYSVLQFYSVYFIFMLVFLAHGSSAYIISVQGIEPWTFPCFKAIVTKKSWRIRC